MVMFLDDELIDICKKADLKTPEQVQKLHNIICVKCENYYKSKMTISTPDKQVLIIIERTFNLFDSFVDRLLKSDDFVFQELGKLFQNNSFKKSWLDIPEMDVIYKNLKSIS